MGSTCNTWEPIELLKLKYKLAHMTCKCTTYKKSNAKSTVLLLRDNDKQVQVEEPKCGSFDQTMQVNTETMVKDHNHFLNTMSKDVLCPSCFVTMSLLRGGVLRVLKDEESETKNEIFSCDKCVGKRVRALEKTTSITYNPVENFSNLTLCDYLSERTSDLTVPESMQERKRNHQVKFMDIEVKEDSFSRPCFCLENFIDSIRPPLIDTVFMN